MIKKIIDLSDSLLNKILGEAVKVIFWILILYFVSRTFLNFDLLSFIDLDCLPECL